MMLYVFIHGLTGRVFKILPLKEEMESGTDVHLQSYLDSLVRDVIGAQKTFPELMEMSEYVSVLNTLQFLTSCEYDHAVCKQEVFKMLRLLNNVEKKLKGEEG